MSLKDIYLPVLFFLTCFSQVSVSAKEAKLLFHLKEASYQNADSLNGSGVPLEYCNVEERPGKGDGKAFYLGPKAFIRYPAENNFDPAEGSLLMWIKPDWASNDKADHVFFTNDKKFQQKEKDCFMLWKWSPGKMRLDLRDEYGTYLDNDIDWSRGQWHHLAITWDRQHGLCLYVDGMLTAIKNCQLPQFVNQYFQFGCTPSLQWPALSSFEDVRIYDTPLNASQIKTIMADPGVKNITLKQEQQKVLFDFEGSGTLSNCFLKTPKQDIVRRSGKFASSGRKSIEFISPKWHEGMEYYPAFEMRFDAMDWSNYQFLSYEVVNPTDKPLTIRNFISDSPSEILHGLQALNTIAPLSHQTVRIPLNFVRCKVNPKAIRIILFSTEAPSQEFRIYVDRIALSNAQAEIPAPLCRNEIVEIRKRLVAQIDRKLARLQNDFQTLAHDNGIPAHIERWYMDQAQKIKSEFDAVNLSATSFSNDIKKIDNSITRLQQLLNFSKAFEALRSKISDNAALKNFAVGVTSSMKKILPFDMPISIDAVSEVKIDLARNEQESFQLTLLAYVKELKGVKVTISPLWHEGQKKIGLASENVNVKLVGYTKTKQQPPYDSDYIGWWPDPLLTPPEQIDMKMNSLLSFWIKVKVPEAQAPGVYSGYIVIKAEEAEAIRIPLKVRVYNFSLQTTPVIPLAITFSPRNFINFTGISWEKWHAGLKYDWADFLADYLITYDDLYSCGKPDFAVIDHLAQQKRLGYFNLGNFLNSGTTPAKLDQDLKETLKYLRPAYEEAKKRNLLDQTYVYGFDELPDSEFEVMGKAVDRLKKELPGIKFMTTARDSSCGMNPRTAPIDQWCPIIGGFDPRNAEIARKAGKKIWWYICCWPVHPYANWFIEYDAIEARLLMGAMIAKYNPDGFLYYMINFWKGRPIKKSDGVFTGWEPVSYSNFHGDGSLVCVDEDGCPIPTIRLENFRDGLEDLNYTVLLRKKIQQFHQSHSLSPEAKAWLKKAEKAVVVPGEVVENLTSFTDQPEKLYQYRSRIAILLEEAEHLQTLGNRIDAK